MVRLERPIYYFVSHLTNLTYPSLPTDFCESMVQNGLLVSHRLLCCLLDWVNGRGLLPSSTCGIELEP